MIAVEDPDVNNFTPVNELTKEQVVSWIENKVDSFALNIALENNIELQQKPQTILLTPPFGE